IDAIIENYVNRILNHPLFHRILYQELLIGDRKEFHEKILSNFSRNTSMLRSVIESGIRKKVFKKADPELTMATLIGTINQVMLSKSLCCMLLNKDEKFDPYTDKAFQHRLTRHLKQLIHAYLLHAPSEES
ncbi:MAG TPA: hypothetical protein VG842_07530, partial [Sediminibacterium sp.]|nr:hypothetical protein [Sediminibacterium sp.]